MELRPPFQERSGTFSPPDSDQQPRVLWRRKESHVKSLIQTEAIMHLQTLLSRVQYPTELVEYCLIQSIRTVRPKVFLWALSLCTDRQAPYEFDVQLPAIIAARRGSFDCSCVTMTCIIAALHTATFPEPLWEALCQHVSYYASVYATEDIADMIMVHWSARDACLKPVRRRFHDILKLFPRQVTHDAWSQCAMIQYRRLCHQRHCTVKSSTRHPHAFTDVELGAFLDFLRYPQALLGKDLYRAMLNRVLYGLALTALSDGTSHNVVTIYAHFQADLPRRDQVRIETRLLCTDDASMAYGVRFPRPSSKQATPRLHVQSYLSAFNRTQTQAFRSFEWNHAVLPIPTKATIFSSLYGERQLPATPKAMRKKTWKDYDSDNEDIPPFLWNKE